jgi:hypothetical protein
VFSLGFKSARLFGRNLTVWDFFLKVTYDFNQSQEGGHQPLRIIGPEFTGGPVMVADPHLLNEDSDPSFHLADPCRTFHFSTNLLTDPAPHKICDHWSTDPPWLHFEPLQLLNFDFSAVLDPVFHSNADPNRAS